MSPGVVDDGANVIDLNAHIELRLIARGRLVRADRAAAQQDWNPGDRPHLVRQPNPQIRPSVIGV